MANKDSKNKGAGSTAAAATTNKAASTAAATTTGKTADKKVIALAPPPAKGQRGGGGGRSAFATAMLAIGIASYGHITSKKVKGTDIKYPNLMDILNGRVEISWDKVKYATAQAAFAAEGAAAFSYALVEGKDLVGYVQNIKLVQHNEKPENANNMAVLAGTEGKNYDCFITATTEAKGREAIDNFNNYVGMPQHQGLIMPKFTALATWNPLLPEHKLESVVFEAETEEVVA